jgi:hypothetical protein
MVTINLMKQENTGIRKRRGRPAIGAGEPVVVRMRPEQIKALDAWIVSQPDPKPSRPEAVRRLLDARLRGERTKGKRAK